MPINVQFKKTMVLIISAYLAIRLCGTGTYHASIDAIYKETIFLVIINHPLKMSIVYIHLLH